jgi:DNA-binding SARP family transcriptional activator/tetratricopeptide (TPR) repeat protein
MEIRLLGLVHLWAAARAFDVGPPQRRVVLAALAVDAGQPVLIDTLIDRVWGERPPARPKVAIHAHITLIRRLLRQANAAEQDRSQARLVHRGDGYVLQADPWQVDLLRFRALVASAGKGTDAEQVAHLRAALDLWRGPALADLSGEWPARMRDSWGLERLDVAVGWARTQLRLGQHEQVIGAIRPLLADYPLAEPLAAVLMRALTATGRRAEALDSHTTIRQRLADELGVDPGPEVQALHQAILRDDLDQPAGPLAGVPDPAGRDERPDQPRCTLPSDPSVFVGRDNELDLITTAVDDAARAGGGIPIHAIDGMPGTGKTALAIHMGHRLAGRFPDRRLFIDLHAYTPDQQPVRPGDALADLLAADGLDPRLLPATVDGRAGLWRDRMAGRRLLLILDNATSTDQVLPLLPGSAGSLVLVTSRRRLADLPGVRPVPLDVLGPEAAAGMFVRLAPRAAADLRAVAAVVAACGHLPLAISITASLYLRHPSWTLADLQADVRHAAEGALTVTAENRTVAAAFDLSYQDLPSARQRFFRLLSLHPGVEIDTYAAASLTGVRLDEAAAQLDELHGDHLLDEPAYRRYRIHDLIRAYASNLAVTVDPAEVRAQAVGRLLDFYQHAATRANAHLARHTLPAAAPVEPPVAVPELASWEQAAAWLRTERANLLACIHHTAAGLPERMVALTAAVAGLLRTDGPLTLAAVLHQAAADTARRLGDRQAEASATHDLADVGMRTADYPGAADLLDRALDLYLALGNRCGQANALLDRGSVQWLSGDYLGAAGLLDRALDLYRRLGDSRGQANALRELGIVRLATGDYPAASDLLGQSREKCRALGDRRGRAAALRELAVVQLTTGHYVSAANLLRQALGLYRTLGDRRGQAIAQHRLGIVRLVTGDYPAAADLLGRALDLYRMLGSRRGEAGALDGLGVVRRLTGDHQGAAELHRRAMDLHRTLGNRHSEALAATRLAVAAYETGDHGRAYDLLQHALAVFREIGAPDDEAEALNQLGILHRITGQPDRALALHRQALGIARGVHHRLEEARALDGIGHATLELGDTGTATAHLHRVLGIYQHLGVPEAGRVAATLVTLSSSKE